MPGSGPYFRGFFQVDGYSAALALSRAYQLDVDGFQESLSLVIPVVSIALVETDNAFLPTCYVAQNDTLFVIAICGTQNTTQSILNITGSLQEHIEPIPGAVNSYHGITALNVFAKLQAMYDPELGQSVVVLGHSLGGSVGDILTSLWKLFYPAVSIVCHTFGAPRPGDPVFCASINANVFRWEDTQDPIVGVPPVQWAALGSSWPLNGPPPTATYQHPGTAVTIDVNGNLTDGSSPMDAFDAAIAVAQGNITPHTIVEYARRLRAGTPAEQLEQRVNEYVDPDGLDETMVYMQEGLMASPGLGATTSPWLKVTLFYQYGGSGMTESFWSNAGAATLRGSIIPGYLQARMRLAVNVFQFLYARISNALNPRLVDFLTSNDAGINTQGILQPGQPVNVKGGGLVTGASDTDALLVRMKLANGPSARIFLHGYDGSQDNEGTFTPNPQFTTGFTNFINFLQAAGSQIYYEFGSPVGLAGRKPITAIAPNTPRGAKITPAAPDASVTPGTVVYIGGVPRAMQGVSGRKIAVTPVDPANAFFNIGGAAPVGTYTGSGAYYYVVNPNYQTVQYASVERIVSHRVGKFFGEPRGRKSNRLSLRL